MDVTNVIVKIKRVSGCIKYLIYDTKTDMYLKDNVWLSSNMEDCCLHYSLSDADKTWSAYLKLIYVPMCNLKVGQRFKKTYADGTFRVIQMPKYFVDKLTSDYIFYINEETDVVFYSRNIDKSECYLL